MAETLLLHSMALAWHCVRWLPWFIGLPHTVSPFRRQPPVLAMAPSWRYRRQCYILWSWHYYVLPQLRCVSSLPAPLRCALPQQPLPLGKPLLRLKFVTQVSCCVNSQGMCLPQLLVHRVQVACPAGQFPSIKKMNLTFCMHLSLSQSA